MTKKLEEIYRFKIGPDSGYYYCESKPEGLYHDLKKYREIDINEKEINTIKIAETVVDKTPEAFKQLVSNHKYRLTKTSSSRPNWFVSVDDTITGTLEIVDVANLTKPCVKVSVSSNAYLRTSPIVEVIDVDNSKISFRTEGGTYLLEDLGVDENK